MTAPLRLVVFDVDGTLVDSQNDIVGCMTTAFEQVGLTCPERAAVLSIVGLSLPLAIAQLAPEADGQTQAAIVEGYKTAFAQRRKAGGVDHMPLYPGARQAIEALHAVPHWLLGVATGKSRRGLNALLDAMEMRSLFVTQQVADDHPSKPHPAMLEAALAETGVAPQDAVMIGDTRFDMEMAVAAGVPFIGVPWGYHAAESLTDAVCILDSFDDLKPVLDRMWGQER